MDIVRVLPCIVIILLSEYINALDTNDLPGGQSMHTGSLPGAGNPPSSITFYLGLSQVVRAPRLLNPLRMPQCMDAAQLTQSLANSINELYSELIVGEADVQTNYYQKETECTYNSFISYQGSASLKLLLLEAVNSSPDPVTGLCAVLKTYCEESFPAGSPYKLVTAHAEAAPVLPPVLDFNCQKHTFSQHLDHFDSRESRTFSQVYWICDGAWPKHHWEQEKAGHVIVFLGNESPLGTPKQPIVFENARRLKALVILVEHRYYGESSPFPLGENGYLPTPDYKWLTLENVIEDTALVLKTVRAELNVPHRVPAVVIGGSYGGMIAAYHRIQKPDVFGAAVAASAPITYITGTKMMAATAHKCHLNAGSSTRVWSGSTACGSTVKMGLNRMLSMGNTASGREQLASTFKLCGEPATAIPTAEAAFSLMNDQLYWWEGDYVQVNNQPTLLGQVELACRVLADYLKHAGSGRRRSESAKVAMEALASVNSYFYHNGSSNWCYSPAYSPDLKYHLVSYSLMTYSYQTCTQGLPDSPDIPSSGAPGMLSPPFEVTESDIRRECEELFGPDIPQMQVPDFVLDVKRQVLEVGGIVFTNGQLDCWAGGSAQSYQDLLPISSSATSSSNAPGAMRPEEVVISQQSVSPQHKWPGHKPGRDNPKLAFVVYEHASHCTDTHNFMWGAPQPSTWRVQRSVAMTFAVKFAHAARNN